MGAVKVIRFFRRLLDVDDTNIAVDKFLKTRASQVGEQGFPERIYHEYVDAPAGGASNLVDLDDVSGQPPDVGDAPVWDGASFGLVDVATQAELTALLDEAVILAPADSARNVIIPAAGDVIALVIEGHMSQTVDVLRINEQGGGAAMLAVTRQGNLVLTPSDVLSSGSALAALAITTPASNARGAISVLLGHIGATGIAVRPPVGGQAAGTKLFSFQKDNGGELGSLLANANFQLTAPTGNGGEFSYIADGGSLIKILTTGIRLAAKSGSSVKIENTPGGVLLAEFKSGTGLAFFAAAPVAQQAASDTGALWTALKNYGLLTSGSTAPDLATQVELDAHLNDTVDAHDASAISVVPFGTIASTDVQAALQEIVAEAVADLGPAVILAPASSARNVIQPTAGSVIAAIVKAHAAQSVDLTQWQDATGTVLSQIFSDGGAQFSSYLAVLGNFEVYCQNPNTIPIWAEGAVAQVVPLLLLQPNGGGTDLFTVGPTGAVTISPSDAVDALQAKYDSGEVALYVGSSVFGAELDLRPAEGDGLTVVSIGQSNILQILSNAVFANSSFQTGNVKHGFFGVTPVAQQAASDIAALWAALKNEGLLTSGSTAPDMATQTELDAHITDATDAHDASAISILDTANDFTAIDVEGALAELQTADEADEAALAAHIGDATDAHAGTAITNTPAGSIGATTVQAAINELDSEKQPLDADLTAIAAVATTVYGRDLLALANQAALASAVGNTPTDHLFLTRNVCKR